MKALILTCSTGQGHNSCAHAVKEYYDSQNTPCRVEDALGLISPRVSKIVCWGHVTMYRHFHSLFQIGYRYSEKHSDMFKEKSWVYRLLSLGMDRLKACILEGGYDQVICTHVFASLMVTELQKRYSLPIHTCLVATDYTCNPGTKESQVDLHFIPDTPLSVFYECPGIQDEQILTSGIPVRQMFYHAVPKAQAKLALGISPSHNHLLMMCGSMGCGPMEKLTKVLSKTLPESVELSVVCGTNRSLQKKMTRKFRKRENVHIWGYVEDMSGLMDSADLYLTKPGGISVTEAAVKNLPMVFIDAVAGCEEYNKIYFIRRKAAKTAKTVKEIAAVCADVLSKPRKLEKMRRNLEPIASVNAGAVIYSSMQALETERLQAIG